MIIKGIRLIQYLKHCGYPLLKTVDLSETIRNWSSKMKNTKHSSVLSVCCCTCIVLALIFLYGCSGATHTISTEQVPIVGSDTIVEEWRLVENPNTGMMEMRLVRKVRTTVSTSSSSNKVILPSSSETSSHYPSHNDTGGLILAISSFVIAVATLYIVVSK